MPIAWNDDPPGFEQRIAANCRALLTRLAADAERRVPPSVDAAQDWHRAIYAGVPLPVDYYAGEVRDDDPRFPELVGYEVTVGPSPGLPAAHVPRALADFEAGAGRACARLDAVIAPTTAPADDPQLHAVLTLCAVLHGEWVRIHPFANGNGRSARVWANWAALRYGLPPFVRLRPRPEGLAYAAAAPRLDGGRPHARGRRVPAATGSAARRTRLSARRGAASAGQERAPARRDTARRSEHRCAQAGETSLVRDVSRSPPSSSRTSYGFPALQAIRPHERSVIACVLRPRPTFTNGYASGAATPRMLARRPPSRRGRSDAVAAPLRRRPLILTLRAITRR